MDNETKQNSAPEKTKSRLGIGILIGVLGTIATLMLAMVVLGFLFFRGTLSPRVEMSYEEKLDLIQSYLDQYYLGELDPEALEDGVAAGILNGTGDKYAEYYSPSKFAMMMDERVGSYCGVGVSVIQNQDDLTEVYRVFEGSPAAEAGIQVKDIIVEVDGEREFENLDALVEMVRGEEGTKVNLVLLRDGKEIPATVERRMIDMQTIYHEMLDNGIGYIEILEFDEITVSQFNEALDELAAQGMTSLILDVRDNPGGDYDTVMKMADRVLPEGAIAQILDKNGVKKTEMSDDENQIRIPMAVLINENSASAAELFSGAIKDYGIATLVGKTTYGKGIIQSIFQLPDGSGMKFTTEEYLTPKGGHINGIGVVPDVEVEIPEEAYDDGVVNKEEDTQLQAAVQALTEGTDATLHN